MRRRTLLLFILLLQPFLLLSFQSEKLQSSSGVTFVVSYRALQPGEIVMVTMGDDPAVKKAVIRFLDKEFNLTNKGEEWEMYTFIGLDLGLKPGSRTMKITILKEDGKWETVQAQFYVTERKFPVKKLWVKERFVTPPAGVRERIKSESEILRMVYSIVTPHWLGRGKFIIPCEGEIFPNFGERRIYNNKPRSSHSGIDISSPLGNPVKASNSGTVALASNLYFSGGTVIIDHGLGLFTLYCHLSKIEVRRGQLVMRGEKIGEIGATGRVTGPHLHWGVKLLGTRVDPNALLSLPLD